MLQLLLKSAATGGLKAWLLSYIFGELYDEIGEPGIELVFRKVGYVYNKVDGKIKVKKLSKARDNDNKDDYIDTVRDILS